MYEKLSKNAKYCMMVAEAIWGLIFTAIGAVVWLLLSDETNWVNWIWIGVAAIWVLLLIMPHVRYERYRYRFTDEEIDVKEGFLVIHRDIVPIERLQKVATASGPIDRIFGLSKVIVTTAGADVTIRFLRSETADQIVEKLKKRINEYAVTERENALEELMQKRAKVLNSIDSTGKGGEQ